MSERIREHLSGAQIDKQFDSISQGGYIRTTPTSSPRSSRSIGSYDTEARSVGLTSDAVVSSPTKAGPVHGEENRGNISSTPAPQSSSETSLEVTNNLKENTRPPAARQPPILKKLSSSSNPSSKSPLVLSPASQGLWSTASTGNDEAVTFDDDPTPTAPFVPLAGKPARKSTTTRFNEEVAVSIPKVSTASRLSSGRLSGESSQRSGRRNPIVVANTGASKKRPPVMRQKSSQASSFGASKEPPSRSSSSPNLARSMKPSHTSTGKSPSQEVEASLTRRSRAASPHPSKHRRRSPANPSSSEENAEDFGRDDAGPHESSTNTSSGPTPVDEIANANSELSNPLVDPDFRSKFEDKTRHSNLSFTNVSSFARKSSAALPTAASFQASGMLDTSQGPPTAARNRGREAFNNEIIPLKAPASAGPEPPAEASQPLSRTKSQLTMLLEREKSRSAGQEH